MAIEAVGGIVEDRRGVVLCPFHASDACPGLPLRGANLPAEGEQVRVGGRYDGVALTVAWVEPWTRPGEWEALENPCTGNTSLIQPPDHVHESLDRVLDGVSDRLVALWVSDGELVVALTGSDDATTAEIDAIDGICVDTGYEHSAQELQAIIDAEIDPLLTEQGVRFLDSGVREAPGPTITIEGDAIDAATVELLADRYGDLVEVTAFITVLDAPLSDLPEQQPEVPGDIDLPTAGIRSGYQMLALWMGVRIEYDEELNCLYVGEGNGRTVIVWPFGYTAVAGDPSVVYDPAGNPIFETGTPIEIGGGGGSIDGVDPEQRCGADSAFYAAGPTEYQLLNR